MADTREQILTRLVAVCGAVSGINAAVRNRLDTNLTRPAVIILDGAEAILDTPPQPQRSPAQEIQRMDITPQITLLVRGNRDGSGPDAGSILSLYRSRLVGAILEDATLINLVGSRGRIRYDGTVVAPPDAEGMQYRADLAFTFTYTLRLADLA